jgi:hypothetical protein
MPLLVIDPEGDADMVNGSRVLGEFERDNRSATWVCTSSRGWSP